MNPTAFASATAREVREAAALTSKTGAPSVVLKATGAFHGLVV